MKTTIASVLIRNAIDYAQRAEAAHSATDPQQEVCCSIGAHLMLALAIEGIGNEVGQAGLTSSLWNRVERADTVVKWYLISGIDGRKPFEFSKEPLQTVQHLMSIRNRIAHPKVEDLGDEVIIRSQNGVIIRNVPEDYVLQDGDTILLGLGKLVDEFNWTKSIEAARRCIQAVIKLRAHLTISGLEWIDDFDKDVRPR